MPLRLNLQGLSPVGEFNYNVVGRLKTGVTIEAAQAELDVLQAEIAREAADEVKQSIGLRALVRPLAESIVGGARRGLMLCSRRSPRCWPWPARTSRTCR